MSNPEEESTEIDEFAMFKARSLGVESEYLEMARVGLLRRSMRQRAPLESMKHRDSYRDQNGVLIGSEDYKYPGQKDSGDEGAVPGPGGHLLSTEGTNLQRAHSFRAQRRTPGEKRPSTVHQCDDHTSTGDQSETGKLSRHRNMTMPARRRFDSRAGPITDTSASADNENLRSRHQRSVPADDDGGQYPIGDRSVLRVRNFTTKDGNIINRGDSIKIRRGTKTAGLSSPLGKDNTRSFGNSISVPQNRDVRLSPRSGSLKSTGNAAGFGARKSIAATLVSSEGTRPFSSSATHLAVVRNEASSDVEGPQILRRDSQLRGHRLSRQFQSQDEERLIAGSNSAIQSQGRLAESELSASTSSNLGSRGFRPPSHSSTQHTQIGEEAIELDYLGEAVLTQEEPYVQSPRRILQQQGFQGSQMSISANVVVEEQNENETEEGGVEVREEAQDGGPADDEEEQVVYKVVVMGSVGVGKTTLTHQMLTSEYLANNENELDDDSTDKIVSVQIDGEESLLQLIDQPGQQGAKRKDALIQADANLVVYSVTDRNSYAFAQTCLQDLRPAKRHNVVILVANKQDLVRNRVISEEDGKSLAHKRHCKFIEVSALLSHKVDDLLVGVTRQIRLRKAVSGEGAKSGSQSDNNKSKNNEADIRVGCLQRAAMDIFRRITRRRRLVESSSCDDLFKP